MNSFLEILRAGHVRETVELHEARVSIGAASTNDVVIANDRLVSRLHAVIDRYAGGWSIRDLGSRNGVFINGDRILNERALHPGDEIRVGGVTLLYRSASPSLDPTTEAVEAPPALTRREREVLVELCRPVLSEDLFTEPATVKVIAGRLFITEAAVKFHLNNLSNKFGLDPGAQRRLRLANEAIRRGGVTFADLRI